MPSRWAVRITRQAISPRLAISSFVNIGSEFRASSRATVALHAEHAESRVRDRRVQRGGERQGEHLAAPCGVNDAVIPQPGARVERVSLVLKPFDDGAPERRLFLARPGLSPALDAVALHGGQHTGCLLAPHHRNAGIRPGPQESRRIGAPAHAVVPGAERAADDHRELRHGRGRDCGDQLRPVLGDAARLVLPADHEAGDVLQEEERDVALRAELDEVGPLQRRLGEQDSVVRDDADRHAGDVGEAAHQRRAVELLELVEARIVHDARDDLAHLEGLAHVGWDDAHDLGGVVTWRRRRTGRHADSLSVVNVADDPAGDVERVGVVQSRSDRSPRIRASAGRPRRGPRPRPLRRSPPSPAAARRGRSCPGGAR